MSRRAATAAATASLLLLAVGLILVASEREQHQLGSNFVQPTAFVAVVPPGQRVCQAGMRVPEGTGALALTAGTYGRPGPALALTLEGGGSPVRATVREGWREGRIVVPIPAPGAERRDARICLANDGPGRIAVAGGRGLGEAARVGRRSTAMIRLEYLEPERRSWWPVVGRIGDRVATVRDAVPGGVTLPLFGLFALGVAAGSLVLVARESRR